MSTSVASSAATKALKWTLYGFASAFFLIAFPVITAKAVPRNKPKTPPLDNYILALDKALLFFNAQKSGKLPKSNGISLATNPGIPKNSKAFYMRQNYSYTEPSMARNAGLVAVLYITNDQWWRRGGQEHHLLCGVPAVP